MKYRILLFLTLAAWAAQGRPAAVKDPECPLDRKVLWGTAASTPINFPLRTMLPTGSATIDNGDVSIVITPVAAITGGDSRTIPELFGDTRATLGENWQVPNAEIRSSTVADDGFSLSKVSDIESPVRDTVEPRATVTTPIKISDVTGLSAALSQINNSIDTLNATVSGLSTTVSNLSTTVDTLTGTVANLVRVPSFVDFELPVGLIDGVNAVFVLNTAPTPASSLVIHRNGIKLSSGFDYSLTGNTILFITGAVPQAGDLVVASYRTTANLSAPAISH